MKLLVTGGNGQLGSQIHSIIDKCESNIDTAFKVNSLGPRSLAMAAEKVGAKLVHVSTDYLPFKEYDVSEPVSVYGKIKLLGEQYVREQCRKYFIVRTSWLYGKQGKNFVYTIMNTAKKEAIWSSRRSKRKSYLC